MHYKRAREGADEKVRPLFKVGRRATSENFRPLASDCVSMAHSAHLLSFHWLEEVSSLLLLLLLLLFIN
jgi:hypothetical protein